MSDFKEFKKLLSGGSLKQMFKELIGDEVKIINPDDAVVYSVQMS